MRLPAYIASAVLASSLGCTWLQTPKPECNNCEITSELLDHEPVPRDLINGERYKSLVIEVDVVEGVSAPSKESLRTVEDVLKKVIDKPKGISVLLDQTKVVASKEVYDRGELKFLRNQYRSTPPEILSIYILYVNGTYSDNKTAGITFGGSSIFIFRKYVAQELDASIIIHEIGHVLGLVNDGIKMQRPHEDPQHRFHDRNPACVMYFQLQEKPNYWFDRDCLDDINAVKK